MSGMSAALCARPCARLCSGGRRTARGPCRGTSRWASRVPRLASSASLGVGVGVSLGFASPRRGASGGCAAARGSRVQGRAAGTEEAAPAGAGTGEEARGARARTADVLVSCPDQKGVVAALAQLFYGYGANIISSDQHTTSADDGDVPMFYQRITVDLSELHQGEDTSALEVGLDATAMRFNMDWQMHKHSVKKRVAILVSKTDHCLWDLLIRHANGEIDCDVAFVASNHREPGAHIAEKFNIPFHHVPISQDEEPAVAKRKQETLMRRLLRDSQVDCVVLARYMQVLSSEFCEEWAGRCINIHHSFLPAFEGARPYHRAHERGVKLIGATAHYVSSELDAGPIIVQDVAHVSHKDCVADLKRKGRDLEKAALAKALVLHVENRLLLHGNKTIVY